MLKEQLLGRINEVIDEAQADGIVPDVSSADALKLRIGEAVEAVLEQDEKLFDCVAAGEDPQDTIVGIADSLRSAWGGI